MLSYLKDKIWFFNHILNFFKKSCFTPFLIIGLFIFLIYTPEGFVKLGLYSDDWASIEYYLPLKEHTLLNYYRLVWINPYSWYRPLIPFFHPLFMWLYHSFQHPFIFYIILFFLNVAIYYLLFHLLLFITKDKIISLSAVVFTIYYIGKSSLYYWFATISQHYAMILFLTVCIIVLRYRKNFILLLFGLFLFSFISGLSYENYIVMAIFVPMVVFIFKHETIRRNVLVFIILCLSSIAVFGYKKYGFTLLTGAESVKNIKFVFNSDFGFIGHVISINSEIGSRLFFSNILKLFENLLTYLDLQVFSTAVFITIFFLLLLIKNGQNKNIYKNILIIGFLGTISFGLIYALLTPYKDWVVLTARSNRTLYTISVFFGLMVFGLLGYMLNKKLFVLAITCLFFVCTLFLQLERKDYQYSWIIQKKLISKMKKDLLPKSKTITRPYFIAIVAPVDYTGTKVGVPIISDFWTATAMLRLTLNNKYIESNIFNVHNIQPEYFLKDQIIKYYISGYEISLMQQGKKLIKKYKKRDSYIYYL